jgi:hypothetical protein
MARRVATALGAVPVGRVISIGWDSPNHLYNLVVIDHLANSFFVNPWITLRNIGFPEEWTAAELHVQQVKLALRIGPQLAELLKPIDPAGWATLVCRLEVGLDDLAHWLTGIAIEQRPEDPNGWMDELRQTWVLCRLGS